MQQEARHPHGRRQRTVAALSAIVLGAALAVGVPVAASSATHSGTKGCGSQYGWVTATTSIDTEILPPGSAWVYVYSSGGTRSRVAMTASGGPKVGGGYWEVWGSLSATGSPYCSASG